MQTPPLSLDYYFIARSVVIAAPVEDQGLVGAPDVSMEVFLRARDALVCIVKVKWGVKGTTQYFVDVEMHGSFDVNVIDLEDYAAAVPARHFYTSIGINAGQIIYSAVRSHITAVTAAGPHMAWFLPTTIIEASDIQLSASDELAGLLDAKDLPKRVAKKKPKKSAAAK